MHYVFIALAVAAGIGIARSLSAWAAKPTRVLPPAPWEVEGRAPTRAELRSQIAELTELRSRIKRG